MTSKIINMAEKLKDSEDRYLESMFQAEPIADDGFSGQVVARIRRRLWLRRLALPAAMLLGGAIAIKPASQLLSAVSKLLTATPAEVLESSVDRLPQLQGVSISGSVVQFVVFGALLLAAAVIGARMLPD